MERPEYRKLAAEAIGTFTLVLGGCGAAVLAAGEPGVGIGWLGVSLAFGLTVLCMAYALGPVSGGHFNPAVSLGLAVARRFPWPHVGPYALAQTGGAIAAAFVLYAIVTGRAGAEIGGFASNGYGDLSPGGYSMGAALLTEIVMTALFVTVILGATGPKATAGFAPIAIGLALVLIHLVSIPVTNTSVNPARSTGVALLAETGAAAQLWLFWVAPLIGAALGASLWTALFPPDEAVPEGADLSAPQ